MKEYEYKECDLCGWMDFTLISDEEKIAGFQCLQCEEVSVFTKEQNITVVELENDM